MKYYKFTYNGGKEIEISEEDYLKNQSYWDGQPAIKTEV